MSYAQQITAELVPIRPADALEHDHMVRALAWVRSGAPLCRTAPPATPNMHLVTYFPVVDQGLVLLGDHISSGLWLPPGGHVEPGEHPCDTVIRECREELRMQARFVGRAPVFLSIAETIGAHPHVDVALWYALQGSAGQIPDFDPREYRAMRWFAFDAVPLDDTDPHIAGFLGKLGSHARVA
ncbi:MAG: NUDIX domain-containing protein [Rhodobacteraceae bacterium]|nr:MAG: NUDIX domain-containing protein [Paracoccaceae bacterium]